MMHAGLNYNQVQSDNLVSLALVLILDTRYKYSVIVKLNALTKGAFLWENPNPDF